MLLIEVLLYFYFFLLSIQFAYECRLLADGIHENAYTIHDIHLACSRALEANEENNKNNKATREDMKREKKQKKTRMGLQ